MTISYHPTDPFGQERELNEKLYVLDHFYTKLLKLADGMHTRTGRELAQRRTAFMELYLEQLKREITV